MSWSASSRPTAAARPRPCSKAWKCCRASDARTTRARRLEELDLDALLARKPTLALVDELAHRNVPGSRHERRWQDVLELLDAGIDVYTTINIQHLESLNDVVHRITGVRVSETVPDVVFDRLRDIVLVDLPPRELIERLQQGKVYVPEQAAHALQAFFSPSNLIALRELAMQTAADRVDSDLREAQAARGLPGVPLRRRVLVAIDGRGQSEYLVRVARRLAERRDAPWTVVTVQTGAVVGEAQQLELDRAFALARRLGGDAEVVHGASIVDALLDHAGRSGASAIVLGRTRERPFARMFNRTLTQQLIQRGAHYELTIVSTPEARAKARRSLRDFTGLMTRSDAGLALVAAALATALGWVAERWIGLDDLSLVFIVAVVVVAARTRMAAAVLAAVLCFLAYNFFFIEPRFTLLHRRAPGRGDGAAVPRRGAGRRPPRGEVAHAGAGAARLQRARDRVAGAGPATCQRRRPGPGGRRRARRAQAFARRRRRGAPRRRSAVDHDNLLGMGDKDRAAADWARKHRQPAGRFTDTLSGSEWWFLPLAIDAHFGRRDRLALPAAHVAARCRAAPPGRSHGRRHRPGGRAHAAGRRP